MLTGSIWMVNKNLLHLNQQRPKITNYICTGAIKTPKPFFPFFYTSIAIKSNNFHAQSMKFKAHYCNRYLI